MYILIGFLILIGDFVTKLLVAKNMEIGESINVIDGVFSITYIRNKGMAWGLLQNQRWLFIGVTIIVCAFLIWYFIKNKDLHKTAKWGITLCITGAIGNLIDRIFYPEGVIDFLSADFIDFPIFNIADMSVCIGAAFIIIYILFFESKTKER